ncbi:tight adherence protein B [Arthrobacter subterraneus]|uniref:Tight adherence protein B n=1 Tax=Arthrobacter subterraneus TaxID=335973 RepID=A0A1G8CEE3_9MICC|nr:type II secretion system F family protein [Arthrobacter subterraneus]SDH43812.1 tight adherence protein B [Arthrobacter subterraneus]
MMLVFLYGTALVLAALGLLFFATRPHQSAVPLDRRRPPVEESDSKLTRFAGSAVRAVERFLKKRPQRLYRPELLELAGVRLTQADMFLLVIAGGLGGLALGLVVGSPVLGVLFLLLAPLVAHLALIFRIARRRAKFENQLGDTLQLLTGGLRAGHSILRAIDAAAIEADAPTSDEMRRVVTETSLGKDLLASLTDTANRMESEDFTWIAQAIQINREVGGDLADVLDQVGETIRERSEIKGQIRALAAEGKFSAYILVALPFAIGAMLAVVSPGYVDPLFEEPLGWVMIGASVVMMTIGSLWLRKIIDLKF